MVLKYFILCLEGSLIQISWGKSSSSGPGMFYQPLWISKRIGKIILGVLAISSLIIEIILGIIHINKWTWIFLLIAAYIVSSFFWIFFLNKSLQITLLMGIFLFIILLFLFIWL